MLQIAARAEGIVSSLELSIEHLQVVARFCFVAGPATALVVL
jgi:hypothetical protein